VTLYYQAANHKILSDVYNALEAGIFRDATFGRDLTVTRNLTVLGNITFGNAIVDNFLIKGRVSTMTAAGDYVNIDATTYQYEEGFEIRYKVSDWADTYTLGSFTTAKFIVQNDEVGSTKTMRAIDTDARDNDVGIGDIGGIKSHCYIKGTTAGKTIGTAYGGESEVEFADTCAARTITTQVVGHEIRCRAVGSLTDADLLKFHGLYITFTETDGATDILGTGLLIRDHPSDAGTRTLTKGIHISIGCTTGIVMDGTLTTGIDMSSATLTTAIKIAAGDTIQFRDSGLTIQSSDDGHLDIAADTSIDLNGAVALTDTITITEAKNIVLGTTTGTKIGTGTTQKIGFFNATPVVQASAMTAPLTDLTHTAPTTPDYAIQDLTDTSPFGFVTKDEGNTVLKVIQANKVHIAEIEAILNGLGFCAT